MSISLCSYNVRGIGNANKREQIFTWLKDKKFDICLLQETHSEEKRCDTWKQIWGKHCFFSGKCTNSEMVGILINPDLPYEILNYTELICGRVQSLELKIHEKPITIINIYGPNKDELNVFETLDMYIRSNDEKNFIIGGDFNTVLDTNLDKKNGQIDTHKLSRQKIIDIIETHDLADIRRDKHPGLKQYTWHSSHKPPILCRLDYFLLSKSIANTVIFCEHKTSFKSDHSIVTLSIDSNVYNRGPGYFKLNNSLLLDSEYQQRIKENINDIAEINKNANPNTLWEIIKGTVRNETIKYATAKKKHNLQIEEANIKEIERLKNKLSCSNDQQDSERIKEELDNKMKEFDKITENKLNGFITRSKAQIIEQNILQVLRRKKRNQKSYLD